MRRASSFRKAALAQAVVALLGVWGAAGAQQPAATGTQAQAQAPAPRQVTVDIAAQPLEAALHALAEQTGLQLVYPASNALAGLNSPRIAGTFSLPDVLSRMLKPNGFGWSFVNPRTVTIFRAGGPQGGGVSSTRSTQGAAAATTATGTPTQPQQTAAASKPPASAAPPKTLATVNVIGTHLQSINPAEPIIILDAESIQSRGYASIEDVLRDLPQNLSSQTSVSTALGETEFGQQYNPVSTLGASAINLRGLGNRSTLVLVNGRRRAGSAQTMGGYTDISSIPLAQVERIEILTDGASAIYGADAVAGVVNIVLKKNYNGTVVEARHEYSNAGGDSSRIDLGHTFGWKSGSLSVSLNARRAKPTDLGQYIHVGPQGKGDFTDLGGVNTRIQNMGQPGVVFESIDFGIGYHFQGPPIGIIPGGQNGTDLMASELIPYDPAKAPSTYENMRVGPLLESRAVRFTGQQDLGAYKLDFGVGYDRQHNSQHWQPTLFDFNFLEDMRNTYIPASNPYNHFGRDVMVGYSYQNEFAGMQLSNDDRLNALDYHVGLSGKLPWSDAWHFEATYSGGRERGHTSALLDLSDAFDPDAQAKILHVDESLNVFGDGDDPAIVASNRKLLESLIDRFEYDYVSKSHTWDSLVRGPLFALPAGKVEGAFGGQYRTQDYSFETSLANTGRTHSDLDAKALFAEIGIPLLKNQPWAKELTLTLAARREEFNDRGIIILNDGAYAGGVSLATLGGFDLPALTGAVPGNSPYVNGPPTAISHDYSATSPLARLAWKPFKSLRLRATWGRSFLTPQSQQLFGLVYAEDATFSVTYNGGTLPPGVTSVLALRGANPNLKPQVATVKTVGFDLMPSFAPGLMLSVTYNDTFFKNYIGAPLGTLSYAEIFNNIDNMPKGMFERGENGVLLWDRRDINFLSRKSRSVDTSASYYFGNDRVGDFRVQLNATRTLQLEAQTLPTLPPIVFGDSERGPSNWVADLLVNWNKGDFLAAAAAHYSSPFRVLDPLSAQPTTYNNFIPNPNPHRHAASYTTFDFQVGYRPVNGRGLLHDVTVRLGVQNAFDRKFPFVDNLYGFVSNRVNVRGRVIYLDVKKQF